MISMANLQSVFLVEDQILSFKVQLCKDNYQTCQISSCLFSLKGVGAGIEIFWDPLGYFGLFSEYPEYRVYLNSNRVMFFFANTDLIAGG